MKKKAAIALKICVTVGLLWFVLSKIDTRELWKNLWQADPRWLVLAFLSYFSIVFLAVWRWRILLRAQGIETDYFPLFWVTCSCFLFNQVLPGQTGGDLARIYYATQIAPSKKVSAGLSVAVDRITGLFGLIVLAGLTIAVFGHRIWDNDLARRSEIAVLFTIFGALVFVALFLAQGTVSRWIVFDRWRHRLPFQKLVNHLLEINAAYRTGKKVLVYAVLISMVVHTLVILSMFLVGKALGLEKTGWWAFYLVVPIINAVTSIPISVGGLGVREYLSKTMFGIVGVPAATAVAISLVVYGINWLTGLVAGCFYVFLKPASLHHEKISEIMAKEEVV